jgi:hypothetical protein
MWLAIDVSIPFLSFPNNSSMTLTRSVTAGDNPALLPFTIEQEESGGVYSFPDCLIQKQLSIQLRDGDTRGVKVADRDFSSSFL